jgi:PAT family beta-lactamase induction signal transducer AmpG
MQLLVGAGLAGVALTIPTTAFFQYTLAFLWLLAFSSATHDIAADGFYMLATTEKEQAFFVGIRSTFYRISMISGQGLLVIVAGLIQSHTGLPPREIQVAVAPAAPRVEWIAPRAPSGTSPQPGVLVELAQDAIRSGSSPREEVTALVLQAHQWNQEQRFLRTRESSPAKAGAGWWTEWVSGPLGRAWSDWISGPLGRFLQQHFGPAERVRSNVAGNVGLGYLRLSHPPEKEMVLTVSLKSGNKSISLVEGARLVVDASNWQVPAVLVWQLDPKLNDASTAVFEVRSGNIPLSWSITFLVLVGLFLAFGTYHRFILPHPPADRPGAAHSVVEFLREFFLTFKAFFRKDRIGVLLVFLLFYRFAEAQLVKMVAPFLLDPREAGGLGLTTGQVGFVYGTLGIIALTAGGLLGGMVASRHGLKRWLWPMAFIMHLPDAMFIYLAYAQPQNFVLINLCVAVEQFGYGFGFTGYMLYMIYIARGEHKTAHYAICTGFMALGMMIPGMFSGWLQEIIGYQHFFIWVLLATLPGFLVVALVPLDREFGRKTAN